ncbi:MAG: DNA/RNA non-specific endonuclease, partial [Desulfobacca sp.]
MSDKTKPPSGTTPRSAITPEFIEEKLKTFIRSEGRRYLQDPNITSVGIGYKKREGAATGEIAIQFTVGRKAAPEALAAMDTELIPPVITVAGVDIPTDVIQRRYVPDFKVVAETTANPRKTRLDPVAPGISVSHVAGTAGTIGCIVYDQENGTPYVLSNWHVLHGPGGTIGDTIVQPGPYDDNRIQQNRLGQLVRSYLGVAGDCALASIEDRGFNPTILALGVGVEQFGEAELGDKVVKSGRTTGVTHGVVTRVHTLTRLDYGQPVGEETIGGFEIGPDPEYPADQGEVSMGGDSGSVWLFKDARGQITNIMAGLHFAGEGPGNPDEYAVAAYPASIFEKLAVALQPPTVLQAGGRDQGFAVDFLRQRVDLPRLAPAQAGDAFQLAGSDIIPYTHFS